jgi:hypothetical protein
LSGSISGDVEVKSSIIPWIMAHAHLAAKEYRYAVIILTGIRRI